MSTSYIELRCPECSHALVKINNMDEIPQEPFECISCGALVGFYIKGVIKPKINYAPCGKLTCHFCEDYPCMTHFGPQN